MHSMIAINVIVNTASFNENEMAYLILSYIVNNCLKSAFKPFKIAFKIDLSMSIPSSSIWNIVICRKDVEQLSEQVELTKFFLLYFSFKCQLSLKKLDYSMLPSIRPLKKNQFLQRPFQFSVNEVFRMEAEHKLVYCLRNSSEGAVLFR